MEIKEVIPLKNELGEIKDTELFLCNQPKGYFAVEMLQRITVHKECARFAEFIKCRNLSDIYYEDVDYYEQLTADAVKILNIASITIVFFIIILLYTFRIITFL